MEDSASGFLQSLREEVIHHKDKRATFVLQKLASVASFFGLGSIQSDLGIQFYWLLFAVPFVSLAFDVYISAEDYKIKRIGAFCRIYRYATPAERDWERLVNQHREPTAVWASLILTVIAIIASALVLCIQNSAPRAPDEPMWPMWPMWVFWVWLPSVIAFTAAVFGYYPWLLRKLPQPHLLEEQTSDLLSAPELAPKEADPATGLRDKAIIALILNTGITPKELTALELDNLDYEGKPVLRVKSKGLSREIPYRKPDEVRVVLERWRENMLIRGKLVFPDAARGNDKPMKPRQINRILSRYPIVVDGIIRTVSSNELRRTYARRLYEDGLELATIQQYLGCADIRPVLGYIGPIAARRESRQRSSVDQIPVDEEHHTLEV